MNREPKLIGRSPPIQKLRQFINKAAKSNATVLLLGETGVGKEVAARLIHASSARKKSPFIKINCANLSDALIESELFGHKKGAFTGAVIDKPGLIEEANGGTFFFDEIADISPNLQAKFLSILEDKELRRLGENKTRRIDVRFILATNNDIEKLVQKGKFREDLYYRISVLFFHIAPLRKRKEDIPLLVHYYLKKMSLGFSQDFSTEREALAKLMRLEFPGNIRELENILERAIVTSGRRIIRQKDIKISAKSKAAKGKNAKFSHEIIVKTVEKYQGNKTSAARALGLSRQWVHKVLKESNRNENDRLS
jgi:transcriptional regulator with PAS, ATPase and Fis domain